MRVLGKRSQPQYGRTITWLPKVPQNRRRAHPFIDDGFIKEEEWALAATHKDTKFDYGKAENQEILVR